MAGHAPVEPDGWSTRGTECQDATEPTYAADPRGGSHGFSALTHDYEERVSARVFALRHFPSRNRSPDPAAAGFSRCFRGLCAVGFALASSLQQPEWFSEARYSPDLSTARIRCRARNRLKIWGQILAPPEHFDAGGVREMEQKSNSCSELQSDRGSALRSDRICRHPGMLRSRVCKKSSSCRGDTKWAISCKMT